ncbi:EamA family transporter [Methylobacterium sp. Leaf118]|uniref:EamA family transporter n=1 Tax=Methylobacterium sp. Leaf118 TaxID=2876562 RepID=UPI001E39EA64|nr:EamA family transporter [Methylobacterium sp. Leaf118]
MPARPGPDGGTLWPVAAVLAAMVSIQTGAAFAKGLFPAIGAAGVSTLRVGFAALILLALWRPWRRRLTGRAIGAVALYGAALGLMNLLFYLSLRTLPLGIAVAIEFTGPLAVALWGSRRPADLAWIGLAVAGLALLLPLGDAASVDPAGAALALAAGGCWALYIVFGPAAGRAGGAGAVALGMAVAALVVAPFGIASAGADLLVPATLLAGLAVALLSSALPYSLEMFALTRMDRAAFGVLMSLEPALAALAAVPLLGEVPSPLQGFAIICVSAASVGMSARRAKRTR